MGPRLRGDDELFCLSHSKNRGQKSIRFNDIIKKVTKRTQFYFPRWARVFIVAPAKAGAGGKSK